MNHPASSQPFTLSENLTPSLTSDLTDQDGQVGASELVVDADPDAPKLPKGAVWQADGSVRLTLAFPVEQKTRDMEGQITAQKIRRLDFYPLNGAAMMAMLELKGSATRTEFLLAKCLRQGALTVKPMIEKMDWRDLAKANEIVGVFTGDGQTTGQ